MEGDSAAKRLPLRENITGQGLILTTLALMCVGVVMVFSTYGAVNSRASAQWWLRGDAKQAMFVFAAMLLLLAVGRMDYRWLGRRPWAGRSVLQRAPTPAGVLLLLALAASALTLVPGVGMAVGGRFRWLRLGSFQFQPSELLRIALLVYLALMLSRSDGKSFWRVFLPAVALIGLAAGLVVIADFGSAAIIGVAAVALLLMAGVRWYYLLLLGPVMAAGVYLFVYHDADRWGRIAAMANPFDVSNPAAYQPRQALIAIANGYQPAGLGGGVAKHGYVPESDTDFIFSILCEELGKLGAAMVIGLFLLWLLLARRASAHAPDRFGALLAAGLSFSVCLQAAEHIAVNLVWLPPTGNALPFVSAGGTSLLTTCLGVAMVVSVTAYRSHQPAEATEAVQLPIAN